MMTKLALGIAVALLLVGCAATEDDEARVAELDEEVAAAADRIAELERMVTGLQRELDELRNDMTPQQDGAAPHTRAAPPSELDYADDVPRPRRRTIVFEGRDGTTRPQSVAGGNYAVTVSTLGNCVFAPALQRTDGERLPLPAVQGNDTAQGVLDGVPAGDWYVDGVTGPSCTWTVTLTPR